MAARKIIVTINPQTADVKVEAVGFQGAGCAALVDALSAAGGTVTDQTFKPEYRQQEQAVTRR